MSYMTYFIPFSTFMHVRYIVVGLHRLTILYWIFATGRCSNPLFYLKFSLIFPFFINIVQLWHFILASFITIVDAMSMQSNFVTLLYVNYICECVCVCLSLRAKDFQAITVCFLLECCRFVN